MTQVNLPNRNVTGDNLWSQVEDNDDAIVDVVNGNIDNGNIATSADINASKLLDGSVAAAKLGTDSVTTAKIQNDAVTTAKVANGAITAAKIASGAIAEIGIDDGSVTAAKLASNAVTTVKVQDGAITAAKVAAASTSSYTASAPLSGDITATKYAQGLVVLTGFRQLVASVDYTTTWFTLAEGFRPSDTRLFRVPSRLNTTGNIGDSTTIRITSAGVVTIQQGASNANVIYFDGVSFPAA